ncbi:MAG: biotin/lipoyl-binding protein [Clostridia bacterium]|nr:biotin/lipoyl-binding protein [Clostridia bacterium]
MKKYVVNVNGTKYEITLETVEGADVQAPAAQAPAAQQAPVAEAAAPVTAPAGGEQITSPMPGTILDVKVASGTTVKKGDIILVLEAMKMENEIMAPRDGKVTVLTQKGSTVESGTPLYVIE